MLFVVNKKVKFTMSIFFRNLGILTFPTHDHFPPTFFNHLFIYLFPIFNSFVLNILCFIFYLCSQPLLPKILTLVPKWF